VHKTKTLDIDDLQKCLMQTWFDFNQDTTDAATDLCSGVTTWDHNVTRVRGHFDHMFRNEFSFHNSPEHTIKLSIYVDPCNGYFLVIKTRSCVRMRLRCFEFDKVVQQN